MTPFDQKRQIETAFELAERYGFQLLEVKGHNYPTDKILLVAAPTNNVFAKDIVQNVFASWEDVLVFFQGYEKAGMAWSMGGKKK